MKSSFLGVITVPLVRNIFQNSIIFKRFCIIAKKRLSTSSCLSVRPSARNNLAPTGRIFIKFYISVFLENLMRKFNFPPNLTKTTVICMKTYIYIYLRQYRLQFFVESEMFMKKVVEKIKTHFVLNNIFSEIRAVYEIMWKNMIQPDRPFKTIRLMRIARWLRKATNTHRHKYCFFTATMVTRTRLNVTL